MDRAEAIRDLGSDYMRRIEHLAAVHAAAEGYTEAGWASVCAARTFAFQVAMALDPDARACSDAVPAWD